jgi:hypothetical protein
MANVLSQRDTFDETANVDYLLMFADQGKQTSIFRFAFAEKKRNFAVPRCHFLLVLFCIYIYLFETAAYTYVFMWI